MTESFFDNLLELPDDHWDNTKFRLPSAAEAQAAVDQIMADYRRKLLEEQCRPDDVVVDIEAHNLKGYYCTKL
jgi:hypothetical protein